MSTRLLVTGLTGFLSMAPVAAAQPSGESSSNWLPGGPIYTVARSGSTVYLGGNFNAIAPASHQVGAFTLTYPHLSGGPCVVPPVNGTVFAIARDGGGGFYIGGRFDRIGAIARRNLAHITAGCAVDNSWLGVVDGPVNALALVGDFDGTLYVGGAFTHAGPEGGELTGRANLAAFSVSRGDLTAWSPAANGAVHALQGQQTSSGHTIYIGGSFTDLGGHPRQRLAVVDGDTVRSTFVIAADAPVLALGLTATSGPTRLLVGGEFSMLAGVARSRLAILEIDAGTVSIDSAFHPDANGTVRAVAIAGSEWSGSHVYAGGDFTEIGGAGRNYVAALSTSGTALPFNPNPDGRVHALLFNGLFGSVFIGGEFTRLGGQRRLNGGRVEPTTGAALEWNPSLNGPVYAIATVDLGVVVSLYVALGGSFDAIGAQRRSNLAAINLDTGELLPFRPQLNGAVRALTIRNDVLYVGGDFTRVDTATRNRLASFAPVTHALTAWNPNADGSIHAVTWRGTTIFAAGDFAHIGAAARGRLAGIEATSGEATSFAPPDFDAAVHALAVVEDLLYVGGSFTSAAGVPAPYLTRLNATTGALDGTWFPALNAEVRAVCALPGVVYVGGVFTIAGGAPRANLAALDPTLGGATTWQPDPDGVVNALSCSADLVYAGGAFATVGTGTLQQTRPRLAALLPRSAGPTATYGTGFRARALGIVHATLHAFDGVLAGATGEPSNDIEPAARLAFFAENFRGAPGPPTAPSLVSHNIALVGAKISVRFRSPVRGPRPTSYLLFAGSSPGATDFVDGAPVGTQFDAYAPLRITAYVRLRAVNAFGMSALSEELSFVIDDFCHAPPDPPQDFGVSVNGNMVTFNWIPGSGKRPWSYRFDAGITSGRSDYSALFGANETTFSTTAPDGVFYARLRANTECGTSSPSSELVFATGTVTGPVSPPKVEALISDGNTVTVSWTAPASGTVVGYRLEAGTGFRSSEIAALTTTGTSLSFSNVPAGTYYARVYAIGASGTSPASDELILVVP